MFMNYDKKENKREISGGDEKYGKKRRASLGIRAIRKST